MSVGGEIAHRLDGEALTVAQAIEALGGVKDQGSPLWADGCDCSNPVIGVDVEDGRAYLKVKV